MVGMAEGEMTAREPEDDRHDARGDVRHAGRAILPGRGSRWEEDDSGRARLNKLQMAAGPVRSDKSGKHTGLYREHCVHCHGIIGRRHGADGRVPQALSARLSAGQVQVQEHRAGRAKPTDEDLERIIAHGIPGTAMPAFEVALTQTEVECAGRIRQVPEPARPGRDGAGRGDSQT